MIELLFMEFINMHAYQLDALPGSTDPVLVERLVPEPGLGEVRVRIAAVSLNYRDFIIAALAQSGTVPRGRIPVSDAAGVVDALGTGVQSHQLGERVAISYFLAWQEGPFLSRYMPSALGGDSTEGVLAEYVVVPAAALVSIPDSLSFIEAATLPCAAVTAWHGLVVRAGLTSRDTVLIPGTGGVGLFALQIAKALGARTIVLSSSDEKLARAHALGMDIGINYRKLPDWEHEVLARTDGKGASIVLELGGADTIEQSLACLAPAGRIVQVGVLTGSGARPNMDRLQSLNADILGIVVGSTQHLAEVTAFYAQHRLHPVVDRVFSFEEVPQAYAYLRAKGHMGKVVVQIAELETP
jgi:NADPH:quinone reductase-like Zn-dependent oxidoreductase